MLKNKAAFFPLPGELDLVQIVRLKKAGFRIAVLGYFPEHSESGCWQVGKTLKTAWGIDTLLACNHAPEEYCLCRPPKPLLITTFMDALKLSYDESWFFASTYETVGMGRAAKLTNVVFVPPEHGALKKAVDRVIALQAPTPAPPSLRRI
jgi:hypothetical protein